MHHVYQLVHFGRWLVIRSFSCLLLYHRFNVRGDLFKMWPLHQTSVGIESIPLETFVTPRTPADLPPIFIAGSPPALKNDANVKILCMSSIEPLNHNSSLFIDKKFAKVSRTYYRQGWHVSTTVWDKIIHTNKYFWHTHKCLLKIHV